MSAQIVFNSPLFILTISLLAKSQASTARRRKGKRSSMAPACMDGPDEGMKGGEEDLVEWCKRCLGRGETRALRYLQISEDLAVFVCDGDQCTVLPRLAPGSQLIVPRKADTAVPCRKRKRRGNSLPLDPSGAEQDNSVVQSQTGVQSHDAAVSSPLPHPGIVQWPYENKMCWLDVSMLLLVQSASLRRCHQALGVSSPLKQLCDAFDAAQRLAYPSQQAGNLFKSMMGQSAPDSHKTPLTGQNSDRSADVDIISSYLREEVLLNDCNQSISDDFLSFMDEELPFGSSANSTTNVTCTSNIFSGVATDESRDALPTSAGAPQLGPALEALRERRRELLKLLRPVLQCEEGRDGSPVSALPALLRLDGATQEHFSVRYRREFYCFSCTHSSVTFHRNIVMSLTSIPSDFSMQRPTMHHPCPQCQAPGQTSRFIYHSLPVCTMVHFSQGVGGEAGEDASPRVVQDFRQGGVLYQLSCLIQYKRNPDHFIIWLRDPSGGEWLKCDDLCSPVCLWQCQEPCIPPSEVHLVAWERGGRDCTACLALQQDVASIQDAPLQWEENLPPRTAQEKGKSSECIAPLRKRSCPAVIGRSSSPLLRQRNNVSSKHDGHGTVQTNVENRFPGYNDRVPPVGYTSVGTPPQSPESQTTKKEDAGQAKGTDGLDSSASVQPKTAGNRQRVDIASEKASHVDDSQEPQRQERGGRRNHMSVGDYLKAKPTYTKNLSGDRLGVLQNIPMQIIQQQQISKYTATPLTSRDSTKPASTSFSLLRTLRALNANSSLKPPAASAAGFSPASASLAGWGPKKPPVLRDKARPPSGRTTPTVPKPKKVQKVRLPRRKFDSFSAFREQNASKFAGYLSRKETSTSSNPAAAAESVIDSVSVSKDDYQSSVLLTPSSSVSSPSACSESSLLNENTPTTEDPQSLMTTMDALCEALSLPACKTMPLQTKTATLSQNYLDDDTFLEGLLS